MTHILRKHLSLNCAKRLKGKDRQPRAEQGAGPGVWAVTGGGGRIGEGKLPAFLKEVGDPGALFQKKKQGDSHLDLSLTACDMGGAVRMRRAGTRPRRDGRTAHAPSPPRLVLHPVARALPVCRPQEDLGARPPSPRRAVHAPLRPSRGWGEKERRIRDGGS